MWYPCNRNLPVEISFDDNWLNHSGGGLRINFSKCIESVKFP